MSIHQLALAYLKAAQSGFEGLAGALKQLITKEAQREKL